jgi:hypothetical protein
MSVALTPLRSASSFLDILKSYWIAEPQDVRADIACDQ